MIKKLEKTDLKRHLQITDPFLMVDVIKNIIPGKSAHGIKYLKKSDWFFDCHSKYESMPGTLQIEAMLQTLIITLYTLDNHVEKLAFIIDIKTKLYSKVTSGTELNIFSELISFKRGQAYGRSVGKINGKIVCEGQFKLISPHLMPHVETPNV